MAISFLELSPELLHCILIEVHPYDLPNLMLTCKDLHNYIRDNRVLHRSLYHNNWDMLKGDVEWEEEVHRLIKLNKILDSTDGDKKEPHLEFVTQSIKHLLDTALIDEDVSTNLNILTKHFENKANVDAFLTMSSTFVKANTHPHRDASSHRVQQASAKLHCMFGVPITEFPCQENDLSPSANTRLQAKTHPIHAFARSKVYDLREYTEDSLWGPFMDDGSHEVDWEKVEAILIDLAFNMRRYHQRTHGCFPLLWTEPFTGLAPNSFVDDPSDDEMEDEELDEETTKIREIALKLDELDPYGVTGTWMRIVCFLDYNELYSFNFINPLDINEARPPLDTEEAIRLIRIKWRVTKIEPAGTPDTDAPESNADWSRFTGQRLPIVHFAGVSRSLHNNWDPDANSRIRGTVRQTPEGEIRWTTFSIFGGEERWRSESVQVGGLRSARGVVGNWFDKDYSESGPAGPTAFWKESDSIHEKKLPHSLWQRR